MKLLLVTNFHIQREIMSFFFNKNINFIFFKKKKTIFYRMKLFWNSPLMICSNTNWIGWALEFITNRCTFQNAKGVWLTRCNWMTIIIWCTVWNRWFLAHWNGRIPDVSWFAVTGWIWVRIQSTFFIQTTCNWSTWTDTIFISVVSNNANLSLFTIGVFFTVI